MNDDDLLPPNDPSLEAGLLGGLLRAPEANIGEILEDHPRAVHYFYQPRNAVLFSTLTELYGAGQPVDVVTVLARLKAAGKVEEAGGYPYLSSLPEQCPAETSAGYYASELRALWLKREILRAGAALVAGARDGLTVPELLDLADRTLLSIGTDQAGRDASIAEVTDSELTQLDEACSNPGRPRGLSTGLLDLDRLTNGLKPGQVFVIAARPAVGKTSLALNIAEHVALDLALPVGFISLEMTAGELWRRLISSRSKVSGALMEKGELSPEQIQAVTRAAAEVRKAPLHISDVGEMRVPQLRAKVRRLARRHGIKLLVLDYLQLVNPTRRNDSRAVEVAEVSRAVKALAKDLGLPIVLLSQLNRESDKGKGRPPRLSDLRDSGAIEQDADVVGLLHRPEPEENTVDLLIEKHRNGPTGKVSLYFVKDQTRFRPLARDDEDNAKPKARQPYKD